MLETKATLASPVFALLAALLLGSCDPDQPLPDAISCETDDDCEDDASFCNGTPTCVKHVTMTEHGPWRIHICEQRLNPRCPGNCDEERDVCLCAEPDADGDGHAAGECGGDDCDDTDPDRNPGLPEVCDPDDLDEDCDPSTFGDRDADDDGFVDARCCNEGPSGGVCGNDCNDTRAGTHPTAVEACDAIDNDCDGAVDEGVLVSGYEDQDGDGYGTGEAMSFCAGTASHAAIADDCDDTLSQVHPGSFRCVDGSDIEFCGVGASWVPASCPGLGLCVVQPDGTGVCLPGSGAGCSDGVDNDGDGLVDHPDDPGCISPDDLSEESPEVLPACSNGIDDDDDGMIDYVFGAGDPGCTSAADDSERQSTGPSCDNGIDDDDDGETDYPDEPSCTSPADDTERSPRCSNGIDDDLDGLIDFGEDPGCDAVEDDSERGGPGSNYTCDNGIDDDMDGVADYPADADCSSPVDSEL